MNQVTIEGSDEASRGIARLAGGRGLSPQSYLSRCVEELIQQQVLHQELLGRLAAADPGVMLSYLDAAPDVEPAPEDRLPEGW